MFFVWGLIVILLIALLFMPKKLSFRENIIIAPIVGYFAWVAHILIGVKLDFVDFGPTKKVEYTDYALVSLVPPLMAVLFLNFIKNNKYLLYVIIWTILSALIEFILSEVGYMKHDDWKMWYSIPVYFVAYFLLHWGFNKVISKHFD
ncbi:hypothetical protein [Mesobacillus selenatarsenatis]|uniref:hypothetical protein n=1 Tax=Mesobacillus selenatarsenatis TaxID=388741 RepID=UPI0005AAFD2F|nr:hypothetical protein [Mesobacillus selenatarsenatis]